MQRITRVEFTNLDKILYPELRITKARVIEFYVKVAPKMLSFLAGRPVVLTRFPNGVDKGGFYEKDAPAGAPSWVKTIRRYSKTAHRDIAYVVCDDLDTLLWLANLAAIEIHVTLSTADSFESPQFIFFDIDPELPAGFDQAVEIALLLKEKLDALGLRSYVKTSGRKGLHILVPVAEGYTFQQTRAFVQTIAKYIAKDSLVHGIVLSEHARSKPAGSVYIDYLQNSHGRTMISPYSLRATLHATVSTPLEWRQVEKGLNPQEFNVFSVAQTKEDPWKSLLKDQQRLEGILSV
jgi:bifunctional non-homologous end joining protein LigD